MQKRISSFFVVLILFCTANGFAQSAGDMCHYSTEGTEFWFGFLENRTSNTHYLQISLTSQKGATVTLTYGTVIETYTVAANTPRTITINNYALLEPSLSESAENKGIHLVSDNAVNVYAYNYDTRSSDVAVIYPTKSLGTEYYAICYTPHSSNSSDDPRSEFLVAATVTGTTVTITTSAATEGGHAAKSTFSVTLNPGQVYQVRSTSGSTGDLTGSHVVADHPIAFYSGCSATSIPTTGTTVDHLFEQIPPLTTWGREFYAVPLNGRTKDTYRILASDNNTVVTNGATGTTKTLSKGEYYDFDLSSSQACKIISTKKILMAQYCRSQTIDNSSDLGDPLMIIISPISQKINDVTFTAYESSLIQYYYINLITLTSETGSITLDGNSINGFTSFSGTKYSYKQVSVSSGNHRLISSSTNKDGGFLAYVYGFGSSGNTESYGYGVGFSLNLQLDIRGGSESDTLLICEGTTTELDAGAYFNKYKWSTGDTISAITVSKQGWYKITAKTNLGCIEKDSIYLKTDKPQIYLGKDTTVCLPGEMTIKAKDGFKSYIWQDNSTNQTFTVEKTGDYSVTVTNQNGCTNSDTIHVDVIMPVLNFSPDYPVATIDHPDITFQNQTEGAVDFKWNFGDGSSSAETSPQHHYTDLGLYHVVLRATSAFGCTDTLGMDVKIVPSSFLIPNAFRPESEISANRVFQPTIVGIDEQNYNFRIFNRLGAQVFKTSTYETGWGGNLPGGQPADQGVYVWIVEYVDIQGYRHIQKGNVMLVR